MVDPDRRPSVQEIEELTELVRRDPSSPAFIDLGEAYLSLGRPSDAIQVGTAGLQYAPDSIEGRVMLARAYFALHQWKEAQAELLKVVKVDRTNRTGFALLGEVLLRRSDYERAVPVLQHAQNLDPTSPQVLTLLKRARAGQPLDPPAPVPRPQEPRGGRGGGRSAPPPPGGRSQQRAVPNFDEPTNSEMPAPPPRLLDPAPASRSRQAPPSREPEPPRRAARPSQQPPPSEAVRPRVVPTARPQNAAQASLRQSAAVGENYLNDLLTGGLLDVAGVRVPEVEYDLRPDRRWGRSTTRMFVVLFVLMFLGLGAGGFYWWYTEKEKAEAVAAAQKQAKEKIVHGDYLGLEGALNALGTALKKDSDSTLTMAYFAEVAGIEALLYGSDPDRVDMAIKGARNDITKPGQGGYREILIGSAAVELSRLGRVDPATAIPALAKLNTDLDAHLTANPTDRWARWLKGRALLAAGQRKEAVVTITAAADGDAGLVVAMIDQADLLVDDGDLAKALELYDRALAKAPDHPLAMLGRALGRAESGVDTDKAIGDLQVALGADHDWPRVTAYRHLALALANYSLEDYVAFRDSLAAAQSGAQVPAEPRFLSRVALAQLLRGDTKQAALARGAVRWYSEKPADDDPQALLVDLGLLVASGLPARAVQESERLQSVRARMFRVLSLLELKSYKDALAAAKELLALAPDNREAQILHEWARVVGSSGGEREAAMNELDKVTRAAKTKLGRHAQGMATLAVGSGSDAKGKLELALKDITDDAPHPMIYRTHTALAQIALAAEDGEAAATHINAAREANPGYQPANLMAARMAIAGGDWDAAKDALTQIARDEKNGAVTDEVKIMLAETLASYGGSTDQDKKDAVELIKQLKESGTIPAEELSRVAAKIKPSLPEALGLPEPPDEDDGGGGGKKRKGK
jgi:tetratricopeptide (TPR) repeat protein